MTSRLQEARLAQSRTRVDPWVGRQRRRVPMPARVPTRAMTAPAMKTHGPSAAFVNGGGATIDSTPAVMEVTVSASRTDVATMPRVLRVSTIQMRLAQIATAARTDHLREVTQAPNGPAPLPKRVQGRAVAAAAIAALAIAAAPAHPIHAVGSGCSLPPVRSGVR